MASVDDVDGIQQAAKIILDADSILVTAGAGMGVDSGLPDFRGSEGLWRAYPALERSRQDYSEVASRGMFITDPARAWGFQGHCLSLYRAAEPHDGFSILRRWGRAKEHGAFVFTSNVDGQFQKAGFAEERVHECHGSMQWVQCMEPWCDVVTTSLALRPVIDEGACRWVGALPRCRCGGLLRPNVLLFNDGMNWRGDRYKVQAGRMQEWLSRVRRPVVIELGAGGAIPTVRMTGETLAKKHGGKLVRINPRQWKLQGAEGVGLSKTAAAGLSEIQAAMKQLGATNEKADTT